MKSVTCNRVSNAPQDVGHVPAHPASRPCRRGPRGSSRRHRPTRTAAARRLRHAWEAGDRGHVDPGPAPVFMARWWGEYTPPATRLDTHVTDLEARPAEVTDVAQGARALEDSDRCCGCHVGNASPMREGQGALGNSELIARCADSAALQRPQRCRAGTAARGVEAGEVSERLAGEPQRLGESAGGCVCGSSFEGGMLEVADLGQ